MDFYSLGGGLASRGMERHGQRSGNGGLRFRRYEIVGYSQFRQSCPGNRRGRCYRSDEAVVDRVIAPVRSAHRRVLGRTAQVLTVRGGLPGTQCHAITIGWIAHDSASQQGKRRCKKRSDDEIGRQPEHPPHPSTSDGCKVTRSRACVTPAASPRCARKSFAVPSENRAAIQIDLSRAV